MDGGLKTIILDKGNCNRDECSLCYLYKPIRASAQVMYSAFTYVRLNLIARLGI